jgi:DNA-binding GntR family transcriptional regulator
MTKAHTQALGEIIQSHQAAINRKRYADAIRLDDQFHRHIAEINELSMLWRAVDISKAQMDRGRHLSIPQPGWGDVTIEQHRAVTRALGENDADAAVAAMRQHLDTSLQNTLSILDSQYPAGEAAGSEPVSRLEAVRQYTNRAGRRVSLLR